MPDRGISKNVSIIFAASSAYLLSGCAHLPGIDTQERTYYSTAT